MNPFYNSFQNNRQNVQSGFDLNLALQNLARQILPTGMSAEQMVRQKIQNGEMTMEQFQQYSNIADQLTGRNRR